jgi:hypothetical protein
MKLSTWRPGLISWLMSNVAIDEWALDTPPIGDTLAFLPPLRLLDYGKENKATATQDLFIRQRYTRDLTYHELPIPAIEGFYQSLSLRLQASGADIADITQLDIPNIEQPIVIQEYGDNLGDWLVTMTWQLDISFTADVETGTIGKPQPVNSIRSGLYRVALDNSTQALDNYLSIRNP